MHSIITKRVLCVMQLAFVLLLFIYMHRSRNAEPSVEYFALKQQGDPCNQPIPAIKTEIPKIPPTYEELEKMHSMLFDNSSSANAQSCPPRERVAIIVPYRNRDEQLRTFLAVMHPFLHRQNLDYRIFLITPEGNSIFNRGKLLNVGYAEATKLGNFACFIFHDVDLFPLDARNMYGCHQQPRHMSVAIDSLGNRIPYPEIFGGAAALTDAHMKQLNGYSNAYWGWGGEDDDMSCRIQFARLRISRTDTRIARYHMPLKAHEETNFDNFCRFKLLDKVMNRHQQDGLSSLEYTTLNRNVNHLYTQSVVDLHEADEMGILKNQGFVGCEEYRGKVRSKRSCYGKNVLVDAKGR